MLLKLSRVVAGLAFSFAVGCGSPSNLDLCNALCDEIQRCVNPDVAAQANCHNACTNNSGALSDQDKKEDMMCSNSGKRRSETLDCYHKDCSQVVGCISMVEGCINR
jgi:hypothetical protein